MKPEYPNPKQLAAELRRCSTFAERWSLVDRGTIDGLSTFQWLIKEARLLDREFLHIRAEIVRFGDEVDCLQLKESPKRELAGLVDRLAKLNAEGKALFAKKEALEAQAGKELLPLLTDPDACHKLAEDIEREDLASDFFAPEKDRFRRALLILGQLYSAITWPDIEAHIAKYAGSAERHDRRHIRRVMQQLQLQTEIIPGKPGPKSRTRNPKTHR